MIHTDYSMKNGIIVGSKAKNGLQNSPGQSGWQNKFNVQSNGISDVQITNNNHITEGNSAG